MAARSHSEKPMSIYFAPAGQFGWSKCPVWGFLGCRIDWKGFEMTWDRDHAKFKMAAILLHQSFFLFLSWFIIDTGSSPYARIGPHAPPLLSTSGTILIRGLLWVILTMYPENIGARYGFRPFFKIACRNENLIWTISPVLIYIES